MSVLVNRVQLQDNLRSGFICDLLLVIYWEVAFPPKEHTLQETMKGRPDPS